MVHVGKKVFDYKGLSCPTPLLKMSVALMKHEMAKGEVIEVVADCPFFPEGIREWCEQTSSALLSMKVEEKVCTAAIRVGGP